MIYLFTVLTSIILGLGLIAVGAYLWLASKKWIAGILLCGVGLLLTLVPIASVGYFMIATSARGS